jgi:hypothetical protein
MPFVLRNKEKERSAGKGKGWQVMKGHRACPTGTCTATTRGCTYSGWGCWPVKSEIIVMPKLQKSASNEYSLPADPDGGKGSVVGVEAATRR